MKFQKKIFKRKYLKENTFLNLPLIVIYRKPLFSKIIDANFEKYKMQKERGPKTDPYKEIC